MSNLPRIAVTRREAAQMCGVGIDLISHAKNTGHLRAKTTKTDADGNPVGKELYLVRELEKWVEGLADA